MMLFGFARKTALWAARQIDAGWVHWRPRTRPSVALASGCRRSRRRESTSDVGKPRWGRGGRLSRLLLGLKALPAAL